MYTPTARSPERARRDELCDQASSFDWLYTGVVGLGFVGAEFLNTQYWKNDGERLVRFIGPATIGLFWGGFLSGGYLSLPKCQPSWKSGEPLEGNVRSSWQLAAAISLVAAATAPAMDYIFMGPVKPEWTTPERTTRVFIAMGTGVVGSLVPYVISPRPWAAKKEIERLRLGPPPAEGTGAFMSYTVRF